MTPLDVFTRRRLIKFIEEFRKASGQLPAIKDLNDAGFADERIKQGLKEKVIEEFYITLTTGTIIKGYKLV